MKVIIKRDWQLDLFHIELVDMYSSSPAKFTMDSQDARTLAHLLNAADDLVDGQLVFEPDGDDVDDSILVAGTSV